MIKRILIVGGASGIGLSIAVELASRPSVEKVYVVDKAKFPVEYDCEKIESHCFDLTNDDYSIFNQFDDVNAMMITAGFGRLSLFKDVPEAYIIDSFKVNTIPVLRLVKRFYSLLEGSEDFYCGVMVSIAGFMSSPFFAVYGATKASLKVFIESVNVELLKSYKTDFNYVQKSENSYEAYWWGDGNSNGLGHFECAANCYIISLPIRVGYQIGKFTPNIGFEYGLRLNDNDADFKKNTMCVTAGLEYRLSQKLALTLNYASNLVSDMSNTARKVLVTCEETKDGSVQTLTPLDSKKVTWHSQRIDVGISYKLGKSE